jgi:hypothetical protein
MDLSTTGKWAIAVGVVLFVLAIIFSATIPLIGTAFAMVFSWIGWILIIAGITLWIVGRKKAGAPLILKRLSFSRHDIIKSTNWIRLGGAEFRKPIGTSLIVTGVLLLILELVFGLPYPLLFVWVILIAVGAILLIWRPYSIEHEHTKKILIKIPDLLSIHTLHTSLRQCIEDVGYVISENLSPGEGSSSSNFNNNIFLLNGGIKAMKKKISPSKLLVPELADTPIVSNILTLFGLGILLTFLGLTLIVHGMTTWEYEDWIFIVQIIGCILMLVGVVILIYDYVTRTSKLARIYVIEEGTAYIPTINIYDPRVLEKPGVKAEPNISVSHTSCELVVTLGATRNRFFDATELENDFKTIMDSVENIIKENMLKSKNVLSAPFENENEEGS